MYRISMIFAIIPCTSKTGSQILVKFIIFCVSKLKVKYSLLLSKKIYFEDFHVSKLKVKHIVFLPVGKLRKSKLILIFYCTLPNLFFQLFLACKKIHFSSSFLILQKVKLFFELFKLVKDSIFIFLKVFVACQKLNPCCFNFLGLKQIHYLKRMFFSSFIF